MKNYLDFFMDSLYRAFGDDRQQHEPDDVECPTCGKDNVERVWSRVVAVTSKKS